MNAEFNWWLLIVGVAAGAGLAWIILADFRREEEDVGEVERRTEAAWIAQTMTRAGWRVDEASADEMLRLHRIYLSSLPPETVQVEPDAEVAAVSQVAPRTERGPAIEQRIPTDRSSTTPERASSTERPTASAPGRRPT